MLTAFHRSFLIAIFALAALARPVISQVAVPATPAAGTLLAWLTAFNSGDKAQLEAYCKKYDPKNSPDRMASFRGMTGGFELLQIIKSDRLQIQFLVKERNSETKAMGDIEVKDGDPAEVVRFGLQALPPGTNVSDLTLKIDPADRNRAIDGAIKNLN